MLSSREPVTSYVEKQAAIWAIRDDEDTALLICPLLLATQLTCFIVLKILLCHQVPTLRDPTTCFQPPVYEYHDNIW